VKVVIKMADSKWTREQEEAIKATDCNLLVAAAAGAGKTAVLVERIIRKITSGDNPLDMDNLLVVTFTKAAAAEMRVRIAEAISAALENNPGHKHLQRQLTLLNKASITTIHSFCLEVIRSNFQTVDLDPGFRVCDETEAELLKHEVLTDYFEEIYEEETNNRFFELLECYGGNRDDQILQNMVLNLYNFVQSDPRPESWLLEKSEIFRASGEPDFAKTPWGEVILACIGTELEELEKRMNRAVRILQASKGAGLDKYLPVFEEELAFIQQLNIICQTERDLKWVNLYKRAQSFEFSRLPSAGRDADKALQEMVKEIRDDFKKRFTKMKESIFSVDPQDITADLNSIYPLMRCLAELVLEFGKRYALRKNEKSIIDFNDIEHYCLEILSVYDNTAQKFISSKVAGGYRERFAEILVDEYQDSNLVQETIIKMISREDSGTLNVFMVGDVKQSIYRFRQAKPELFLEKYENYSPDETSAYRKILLFKNFRSRREVIDTVNFLFSQIMSVKAGELGYTEKEALFQGAAFPENNQEKYTAGGGIEFHLIQTNESVENQSEENESGENEPGDNNAEEEEITDNIRLEARLAVNRVLELMKTDEEGRTYAVFDKERRAYRRLEYRDIVILLRTTKNWSDVFAEELNHQGIPSFADTGTGFFKTTEVRIILSLLQIIDNPLQDIPLLAVLRSPLFSFTPGELAEIRLAKRHGYYYQALQAMADRADPQNETAGTQTENKVLDFLEKLQSWRDRSFYLSTDTLIWLIYSETGFYGIAGAMPGGKQRQANLRVLFERARQYEQTSYKGLFNFINFIDRLKSSRGDMGNARLLGENDNVVRIMSIHKSKGLEFPVVILAGCGKKFNLQDMNKSILFHHEYGLGPDVVDYKMRLSYPSLPKMAIREKIKVESLSEEMRILYVALTRAREKLIITGSIRDIPKTVERWKKIRENGEEGRLSAFDILHGERYLDWIGPALLGHQNWSELFRSWERRQIIGKNLIGVQEDSEFYRWLEEPGDSPDTCVDLREEVARRLTWEYPWPMLSKIPAKISVTELKRRLEKEFSEETDMRVITKMTKSPAFLEAKKGLTSAEKGTIVHFVMQHLDFEREDIIVQVEKMVDRDLLTRQQIQSIDLSRIDVFLKSPLGKRMTASGNIQREVPYNLAIPCSEIFGELDSESYHEETVLLQGVIDCYFEEADGLVLIDYKTDYIAEGQTDNIKEKYRHQIMYYTRALETLTGKKVKEKYIYLFNMGEAIVY